MSITGFLEWLGNTPWSIALHESLWVYPIVESVHVLALCLFLGLVVMMDLRLLGVAFRSARASDVAGRLLPWIRTGFAVMLVSGVLLFYAVPLKTYQNIFFRVKLAMLIMAGINVWVFHSTIYRTVGAWDLDAVPPRRARLAGALSLALWGGIVVAGRMIAYSWFD